MALAHRSVDEIAGEIAALATAEKVKLLSRLMEEEGAKIDWSTITRIQRRLPDTPALRREVNETVREVRRDRRGKRR